MPDIELGGMLGIAEFELGGMPILFGGIPMPLGGIPILLGGIPMLFGGMPMLPGGIPMGPGIPPTGVTGFGGILGGIPLECVTEGPNWGFGEILPCPSPFI